MNRYGFKKRKTLKVRHDEFLSTPPDTILTAVNDFVNNNIKYRSENKDYWQSPLETIEREKGDCEDIAISKYDMLKRLGVAEENLRFANVKSGKDSIGHMVLVYTPSGSFADGMVLDNIDKRLRPIEHRTSLSTTFNFNLNGNYDGDDLLSEVPDSRLLRVMGITEGADSGVQEGI